MANGAIPVANAAAGQAAPTAQQVIGAAAAQLIIDQAAAAQLIFDQAAAAAAAAAAPLPPPAVIAPRDWDTLVAEAHTIAHLLLQETNATPWDNPAYQADAAQWSYADDMGKNYYLTVIENKWEVISAPLSLPTGTDSPASAGIVSSSRGWSRHRGYTNERAQSTTNLTYSCQSTRRQ
jgi:hypothetical protein